MKWRQAIYQKKKKKNQNNDSEYNSGSWEKNESKD